MRHAASNEWMNEWAMLEMIYAGIVMIGTGSRYRRRLTGSLVHLNLHYISAIVEFLNAVSHVASVYIAMKLVNKTVDLTGRKKCGSKWVTVDVMRLTAFMCYCIHTSSLHRYTFRRLTTEICICIYIYIHMQVVGLVKWITSHFVVWITSATMFTQVKILW